MAQVPTALLTAVAFAATAGLLLAPPACAEDEGLPVVLRSRKAPTGNTGTEAVETTSRWAPGQTAIVVCDMWNSHHCFDAKERVVEMAPFMNGVLEAAREKGVLIIHAPSDCMGFYKDTPQRRRAQEAPFVEAPTEFQWNNRDPRRESDLPVEPGCDTDNDGPRWTRQIEALEIGEPAFRFKGRDDEPGQQPDGE